MDSLNLSLYFTNIQCSKVKIHVSLFLHSGASIVYLYLAQNIDLILLWHTQLIVYAENVKSWFKSWDFSFTFQAYILQNTFLIVKAVLASTTQVQFTYLIKLMQLN